MGPGRHNRPGAPAQKAKNTKLTLATLWVSYMQPHKVRLSIVIILAILSTVFMVLSPHVLGMMTDVVVDGLMSGQGIDYAELGLIGLWLAGLYGAGAAFAYLQSFLMTTLTQRIVGQMRRHLSEKINQLPLRYFDKHQHGEVISRVTNDVDTIGQSLNQSATQLITAIVTVIGILIMMLITSWQLTLVALAVLVVTTGATALIVKLSQRYYVGQQAHLGAINSHVEEMFSGHAVMRVYNGEKKSIDQFEQTNAKLHRDGWKSQFFSGLMMPVMHFISNLGFVGVAVLGGWLALQGKLSIGSIQAFIQYMNQFTQPITQTASVVNVLQSTVAAAERVFEFLQEPNERNDEVKSTLTKPVLGKVDFQGVQFSYTPDKPVIKDFTAHIKPGQHVAIVGPTGAGKTTVVNLLMRFYDLDGGSIKIDDIDIADVPRADVRSQFGMVLQDTWLFNGTIAENIAYGVKKATRKDIERAAKAARADHFIRTLPKGYDTVLGEETDTISAGEKQLLTIARAMLADTPMMILDEATSSVDTRTERLIQEAMDELTKGRTSFVIAHRLSTIRNADIILVMKEGNIVEQGTHDQLVTAGGFYQSLYDSQFGDTNETE